MCSILSVPDQCLLVFLNGIFICNSCIYAQLRIKLKGYMMTGWLVAVSVRKK